MVVYTLTNELLSEWNAQETTATKNQQSKDVNEWILLLLLFETEKTTIFISKIIIKVPGRCILILIKNLVD